MTESIWPTRTLIVIVALTMSACTSSVSLPAPTATGVIRLPHSMKGYELYSWLADNRWHFTLITGTNRVKSVKEIMSTQNTITGDWIKITVQGTGAIQDVLRGLAPHEALVWVAKRRLGQAQLEADPLTLPPQEMIDGLQAYCQRLGVELTVAN